MEFEQTNPIYFEENIIIDRFPELIEEEKWQENCLIVMENVFFNPEETGYMITDEN